jgi:pimeloyl-ACP methyl ester carboxylesterase
LSVLELHDVENHSAVTPDQPLRLEIAQPLAPGEHLLPVTHDGEFYLPIGRSVAKDGGIEVELDALPAPQDTRSLTSAVRIFFQKILSERFNTQYKYPLLAAFEPDTQGGGNSEQDPGTLKRMVNRANRIVLYIHGIIGETSGMAASSLGLAGPPIVPGVRDRYDLVLTFDYENLHTPIEENARLLKQRLIDAGLGPNHGKTVHVIAHSMGGLVSRWFIEREGGNQIVQQLVMLGTPNGGSPWATIEDWAITALSFGLNNLSPLPWTGRILGGLVAAIEKIDVALDQMHPSSTFLQTLHSSPDPGIPYTIVAGNTSLLSPPGGPADKARVRLLDRLKSLNLLHLATAPAFFGEPNDIAVSIANIRLQPPGRAFEPRVLEIPCDHLTYFSTATGLSALSDALTVAET